MIRFRPSVRRHAIPGVLLHPLVRERACSNDRTSERSEQGFRLGALVFAVQRALALLLVLIMAGSPLSPVFAAAGGSDSAHAVHVSHDSDHGAEGPVWANHHSTTCTQHDSCAGQDRDCCAHCFGVVSPIQATYLHSHPVQTPVLKQLHPFFLVASPDRPPRFLSL